MSIRRFHLGILLGCTLLLAGCVSHPVTTPATIAAGWQGRSPNTDQTFRFVVLSDRTGGHVPGDFENAIAEVNLLKPDFVICVGDLVEGYQKDESMLRSQWMEFEQIVSMLDAPFYYVPGNHDVGVAGPGTTNINLQMYAERHGVCGKTYYSFDYKNCHFLVLNSITAAEDPKFCEEQLAFIRQDLVCAKKADHTFVFTHYPLWTDTKTWPTLAQLLPRDKSTIFNGHWHRLSYHETNGIPSVVLSSTAAQTDGGVGEEHSYAQVVVNHGQPSIALIPTGQIKPIGYAQKVDAMYRATGRGAQ